MRHGKNLSDRPEMALTGSTQNPSPLKSVGMHKLKGDRKGQWAMTVNARWRICFVFKKGDAHNVEIVDYHKG
jgi:proteic killer suppression protein